ncbi:hypothetical protein E2C01_003938 [Portunus trituberculatus]|uniref:Uncharacterized protein n=1 Tax=Portunus trituberculatus TaxID=210409 RepID=A0A5B7CNJ5_PORTR|nr:hypothetical protein [Portunus trituberculatus]
MKFFTGTSESLYLRDKERPFPHGVDDSFDEESLGAVKRNERETKVSDAQVLLARGEAVDQRGKERGVWRQLEGYFTTLDGEEDGTRHVPIHLLFKLVHITVFRHDNLQGVAITWLRKQCRARADYPAGGHDGHTISQHIRLLHVVRGDQNGTSASLTLHHVPHPPPRLRVQATARLVQDHHLPTKTCSGSQCQASVPRAPLRSSGLLGRRCLKCCSSRSQAACHTSNSSEDARDGQWPL